MHTVVQRKVREHLVDPQQDVIGTVGLFCKGQGLNYMELETAPLPYTPSVSWPGWNLVAV